MQFLLASSVILLWIAVLLNLFLTLGIIRKLNGLSLSQTESDTRERLPKGEPAPDFTAETLDGQQVSLATFAGRSVAFQFLSTHCNPCREILPELLELAVLAANAGVEFVLVMLDEAPQARAFVQEFQISLPVLVAPRADNDFAEKYKVHGTPNYCLIDGQGRVLSTGHPKLDEGFDLANSWRRQKPHTNHTVAVGRGEQKTAKE